MSSGALSFGLQIIGTIIGGAYGGTWGAYFGNLIGGIVGQAFAPAQEGPRLGDLSVRASTYGKAIPLIYGRENRIGGNVIWSSGLTENADHAGDWLRGKTVTYTYSASFAVALGQGVMRNLDAIYANGKLIWTRDATISAQSTDFTLRRNISCGFNPGGSQCAHYTGLVDYVNAVDTDLLLPDFEPWICTSFPTASSDGGGEYNGVNAAYLPPSDFAQLEWFPGTDDQPVSQIIQGPTPAYRGTAYIVISGLSLAKFGNQIPTIEVVVAGNRAETVAEILDDIRIRAGASIDEVVARGALSEFFVRGYAVASASTAMNAIKPLMMAYPFDACDHAGVVRFTPRRQSPVCTIPLEDMGAHEANDGRKEVFPIERIPNYELPSEASVTYIDPLNAYQPSTQTAIRASGNALTKYNDQVPLTMGADQARALAERMLYEGWLSRENVKPMTISRKYDFLQPGNVIATEVPGGYTAFRILDLSRGDNGVLEASLMREDRLAYDGDTPGGDPFIYDQSGSFIYEPTTPFLFNAPALDQSEDDTGFSVAMDSSGAAWPFGLLWRSTDAGVTWTLAERSAKREVMAFVLSIGDGPTEVWDRETVILLSLLNADATLPTSVDEDALLNDATLNRVWVGPADGSTGEVIQFATVSVDSDGLVSLSNLLRGRRGTEYATGAHTTDDMAVFIPASSTDSLDYGVADWNLARNYMALSQGETVEQGGTLIEFTATGERKMPRAPVGMSGTRDGSNNLTINWTRRTRLFAPVLGGGPVPLDEAAEAYEVDVIVASVVVRTISVTAPTAAYSAADQTTDGSTPGDPVSGNIYQISATHGRGHAAAFTV